MNITKPHFSERIESFILSDFISSKSSKLFTPFYSLLACEFDLCCSDIIDSFPKFT